jgi:hypothetical protein
MKKSVAVLLALLMVILSLPLSNAFAVEQHMVSEDFLLAENIKTEDYKLAGTAEDLDKILVDAWDNVYNAPIDVSDLGLNTNNVASYYFDAVANHPEYFYVDKTMGYSNIGTTVLTITPTYLATGAKLEEMRNKFRVAINDALSNITSDMSDVQKALTLHDYICSTAEYDSKSLALSQTNPNLMPPESVRAYGVLVNKTGVCQSYSFAYKLLLQKYCNIKTECVSSPDINHMWNKVKIGDSYYHVDTTWDDPVADRLGRVTHDYFLKSNDDFPNHATYPDVPPCNNTTYDGNSNVWSEINCKMCSDGTDIYFVTDNCILKKHNFNTNQTTTVKDISDRWYVDPSNRKGSYWVGYFGGLELINGKLYYNKSSQICSVNKDGTNAEVLEQLDSNTNLIYGLSYRDGKIVYTFKNGPEAEENIIEWQEIEEDAPQWDIYVSKVISQPTVVTDGDDAKFSAILRNTGTDDLYGIAEITVLVDNVKVDHFYKDISLVSNGMEIATSKNSWESFFGSHSAKFVVSYPVTVAENDVANNKLKERIKVTDA